MRATALKAYDVMVDRGSLQAWQPNGTAYSVQLIGRMDKEWTEAYRVIRTESTGFSRFHLDPSSKAILFTCRAGDEPTDIDAVMDMVEALVELANLYASSPGPALSAG